MPTSAKSPMVVLSTPTLDSQYDKVESVRSNGRPEANPIARMMSIRGVRYVVIADHQSLFTATASAIARPFRRADSLGGKPGCPIVTHLLKARPDGCRSDPGKSMQNQGRAKLAQPLLSCCCPNSKRGGPARAIGVDRVRRGCMKQG